MWLLFLGSMEMPVQALADHDGVMPVQDEPLYLLIPVIYVTYKIPLESTAILTGLEGDPDRALKVAPPSVLRYMPEPMTPT